MGIYLHARPLLLSSSLGIRWIDFNVHVMIVGAFEYVVVQCVQFLMSKYFYIPVIQFKPALTLQLYYSCVSGENVKWHGIKLSCSFEQDPFSDLRWTFTESGTRDLQLFCSE